MIFVIDVGNSHTTTGVFDGETLIGQWRLKSDKDRTDDELAIRYHALFSMAGIEKKDITGIVLASVVPTLKYTWISCCEKHFSASLKEPVFTVSEETVRDLIQVQTDSPHEVGADRLVNGLAAWQQYKCSLVIIDFGTAITFDCVNKTGKYIGGAILPGIAISLEALSSRTAKLPHIDISKPPASVIGTNTITAMKSGVLYGYGAMVDGLVTKISQEMVADGEPIKIIATGGMAQLIAPFATLIDFVDPLLTLKGLKMISDTKFADV